MLKTQIGNLEVSTVHLELNHGTDKYPQWYETLVFGNDVELDETQARYANKKLAIEGHKKICDEISLNKIMERIIDAQ